MAIEAPELMEIEQVCDFAETRLEQISEAVATGDEEPLGGWEGNCLPRVRAWLQQLKKLLPWQQVALANETATKLSDGAIEPMLTISTAHITKETAQTLEVMGGGAFDLITFTKGEYGWLIWVSSEEPAGPSVPDELTALLLYAHNLGCAWLCLDRDAAEHPDLPTFDW